MNITEKELTNFRTTFADYPEALAAIDKVEFCGHNLEAAANAIALENGYTNATIRGELDRDFLDGITDRARKVVCHKYTDDVLDIFKELRQLLPFPVSIATLLTIKIVEIGVENFCASFEPENSNLVPDTVN
ncbi:MAG: hypothetical protein AAF378_21685 [Cyanobacteria bacterium P01_A01_bin.84]